LLHGITALNLIICESLPKTSVNHELSGYVLILMTAKFQIFRYRVKLTCTMWFSIEGAL